MGVPCVCAARVVLPPPGAGGGLSACGSSFCRCSVGWVHRAAVFIVVCVLFIISCVVLLSFLRVVGRFGLGLSPVGVVFFVTMDLWALCSVALRLII